MRITIAEYAKWKKVSVQAITWRLRKNAGDEKPLNTDLPDVTAVHKLGRSYELEFNGYKGYKGKLYSNTAQSNSI